MSVSYRKGSVWTWTIVTLMVFIVGLVWILMSQVYVPHIFPEAETQLSEYNQTMDTFNYITNVWDYWPIITIFLLILYGVVSTLRKEPNEQYYQ